MPEFSKASAETGSKVARIPTGRPQLFRDLPDRYRAILPRKEFENVKSGQVDPSAIPLQNGIHLETPDLKFDLI
jgi:hypothetical protein